MAFYTREGTAFLPSSALPADIHNFLPAGNYIVKCTPTGQFYVDQVDTFNITGKVYGDTIPKAQRILNTFNDRPNCTGVLLAGEKGSGKTLLGKMISQLAGEADMPTLIINTPFTGDSFNQFIQRIDQPAVILFDEFEKVFDSEQQEAILTLLDGAFPTKKLFILTCNDQYRIDQHMRNRPGRIYYMLEFKGLDVAFIEEYCQERLDDKSHIPAICKVSSMFHQFNFDLLKALVEEMNRYHESPIKALEMLNAKPSASHGSYNLELTVDGKVIPIADTSPEDWDGSPIARSEFTISHYTPTYADDDCKEHSHVFLATDLKKINATNGQLEYINAAGDKVVFTRVKHSSFDYRNFEAF